MGNLKYEYTKNITTIFIPKLVWDKLKINVDSTEEFFFSNNLFEEMKIFRNLKTIHISDKIEIDFSKDSDDKSKFKKIIELA